MDTSSHSNQRIVQLGLCASGPCSYLEGEVEQLLLVCEPEALSISDYQQLLGAGFRRTGNQLYRPHCPSCRACQSLRLPVDLFQPSKSQKRVLNKNQDLTVSFSQTELAENYPLYEKYINSMHRDGGMYPANLEQYQSFSRSNDFSVEFMYIHLKNQLIAVAITDGLPEAMSAVYFFYDPDYQQRSLGVFAVLSQIEHLKQQGKPWLYLGYQIDECRKMNYKTRFTPHQRLINEQWQNFN